MQHTRTTYGIASLVALAGLATACSGDSTSVKTSGSQLAFTTGPKLGALADAAPITINGHTLTLSAVTITVARAELKPAAAAVCAGDDNQGANDDRAPSSSASADDNHSSGGQDDCGEMKIGPTTIDLPLDGSVVTVPADAIPAGTFQELELRLAFIRLQGTFDGKAFDVTLPINGKMVVQFSKPLVVTDSTPTSITIDVPIAQWLTNSDGSIVNPNTILSNPTVFAAVKARIAATFHVFRDDNHNGHDDDHDGGDHDGN